MSTISGENNNSNNTRALFLDRTQAASLLAEKLKFLTTKELTEEKDRQQQLVIFAIPRGQGKLELLTIQSLQQVL
jgi:hypothetical protein